MSGLYADTTGTDGYGSAIRVVHTYVCFLTVDALRSVALLSPYQISTTGTVPSNSEAK